MQGDSHSVVCAWCNATVFGTPPGESVSHGICVPCAVSLIKRLPPDYLKSIAEPDGAVTLFSGYRVEVSSPADAAP